MAARLIEKSNGGGARALPAPLRVSPLLLPAAPLTMRLEEVLSEMRCNICQEVPAAAEMWETPCCCRVVHRSCIRPEVKVCPWRCNATDRPPFSTRSLVRSTRKAAFAAVVLGGDAAAYSGEDGADLAQAWRAHQKRTEAMRQEAKRLPQMMEYSGGGGGGRGVNSKGTKGVKGGGGQGSAARSGFAKRARGGGGGEDGGSDAESEGGGGGGAGARAPARAPGAYTTRFYTATEAELSKGVAIISLKPTPAPPAGCSPTPLPVLPPHQRIISVATLATEAHIRCFIEYALRKERGTLPPEALNIVGGGGAGAGAGAMPPVVATQEALADAEAMWGVGAGARVALYVCLPNNTTAPPDAQRRWPAGHTVAKMLCDPVLWNVEDLEDSLPVIYYALLQA